MPPVANVDTENTLTISDSFFDGKIKAYRPFCAWKFIVDVMIEI